MSRPGLSVRSVDTVLDTLRRAPRELTRNPRGTIEVAVQQLLGLARGRAHEDARKSYRIDDLARASNITVRNIRAYQERGLLHPPHRKGRIAIFDDSHLSRLKIITSMLERGYTSGTITEMLGAWEAGQDLADVLGLERALVPDLADPPRSMSPAQARELAGSDAALRRYVAAGLVETSDDAVLVRRPDLLRAFAEMHDFGMPIDALVALHGEVSKTVHDIARLLVDDALTHFGDRFTREPSGADVGELVVMLTRFRELATSTVMATLAESIERRIEDLLSDYLATVVLPEETG